MKKTVLILFALFCIGFSTVAKPIKKNFSYAMQRANEAYNNDDYDECLKW
ncbi:MAG: hypothetical protein K2M63_05555 [Muribaculaceae bacterium]|nr:hypothetical protein [Muribaculaceae bacterium]